MENHHIDKPETAEVTAPAPDAASVTQGLEQAILADATLMEALRASSVGQRILDVVAFADLWKKMQPEYLNSTDRGFTLLQGILLRLEMPLDPTTGQPAKAEDGQRVLPWVDANGMTAFERFMRWTRIMYWWPFVEQVITDLSAKDPEQAASIMEAVKVVRKAMGETITVDAQDTRPSITNWTVPNGSC